MKRRSSFAQKRNRYLALIVVVFALFMLARTLATSTGHVAPTPVLSLANPTIESTGALMRHPRVSVILATGGTGLVQAAYSSGKPAYGVGPGNVPVYIGKSADVPFDVEQIHRSKTFDNGTICASEQAMVVRACHAEQVHEEFARLAADRT